MQIFSKNHLYTNHHFPGDGYDETDEVAITSNLKRVDMFLCMHYFHFDFNITLFVRKRNMMRGIRATWSWMFRVARAKIVH